MNNIFFSIIIPVYNTPADSLERCINSVKSQLYSFFECIIVDDGSKNETAIFLERIAMSDERIQLIHQNNAGVSAARNAGIVRATGDYTVFIDSDDEVNENYLKEAAQLIDEYSPDIIFSTLDYVPTNNIKQSNDKIELFSDTEINEITLSLLNLQPRKLNYHILGSPCGRVYSSLLAKNVLFPLGVPLCEDQIFNRRIVREAKKVLVVPNHWYSYRQNFFSATHKTMNKSYINMAKPYWEELYRLNTTENPSIQNQLRIVSLGLMYTAIKKDIIPAKECLLRKIQKVKRIANERLFVDAVCGLSVRNRYLSTSQRIGLVLLKMHLYFVVYLGQKLLVGVE